MKIGELARSSGVSQRSLRYYEAKGLLALQRTRAGHRVFTPMDLDRVRIIRELFDAGFCTRVIRDLLPRIVDPSSGDVAVVQERFAAARRRLRGEIALTYAELASLDRLGSALGLAPDMHVSCDDVSHEQLERPSPAALDHRSRRFR